MKLATKIISAVTVNVYEVLVDIWSPLFLSVQLTKSYKVFGLAVTVIEVPCTILVPPPITVPPENGFNSHLTWYFGKSGKLISADFCEFDLVIVKYDLLLLSLSDWCLAK